MRRLDLDLKFLSVDLSHSLHLSKTNNIPIIETVLLLLMQTDKCLFLLGDSCNVHIFSLFSCRIEDPMFVSEIHETETIKSQIPRIDKAYILLVGCFV